MDRPTTAEVARFFDKVNITKSCWLWIGCTVWGYGQFKYCGKIIRVHRFSYELFVGPIGPSKMILHTRDCGNRNCVNPHHLYMGTNADNMRDLSVWGNIARGESRPHSKLSEDDVLSIRSLYKNDDYTYKRLSNIFGVSITQIGNIVLRKRWRHL